MTDPAREVRQVGRLGPARRCNGVPLTKTCTTYAYAQSAGPGVRRELGLGFGEYALSNTTFQDMQQAPPGCCPWNAATDSYELTRIRTHPIKTSSNIHNDPVLLYRCVTTMSLHQYRRSRRKFARASHQEPCRTRWRCISSRDALGCIHYHKTSGASTSGKSELGGWARGSTTKAPNPIWTVLMVNIIYCK